MVLGGRGAGLSGPGKARTRPSPIRSGVATLARVKTIPVRDLSPLAGTLTGEAATAGQDPRGRVNDPVTAATAPARGRVLVTADRTLTTAVGSLVPVVLP